MKLPDVMVERGFKLSVTSDNDRPIDLEFPHGVRGFSISHDVAEEFAMCILAAVKAVRETR